MDSTTPPTPDISAALQGVIASLGYSSATKIPWDIVKILVSNVYVAIAKIAEMSDIDIADVITKEKEAGKVRLEDLNGNPLGEQSHTWDQIVDMVKANQETNAEEMFANIRYIFPGGTAFTVLDLKYLILQEQQEPIRLKYGDMINEMQRNWPAYAQFEFEELILKAEREGFVMRVQVLGVDGPTEEFDWYAVPQNQQLILAEPDVVGL